MNNDLISRSALKKAIDKFHQETLQDNISINALDRLIDYVPTVVNEKLTTERQQGEWIMNKTSARGRNYTCTNCQKVSRNKSEFCPKCGAKMRGEEK